MKRLILSSVLALAMVLPLGASTASGANNSRQAGLVNVSTGDVELLNGVNLAVAANVIATVCDVNIPIAVLATQIAGDAGATFCTGTANPITIEQSQPADAGGLGGGNNSNQAGLVNVSLGDVAILNDVNLAVAANVLVTACDLNVPVAVLALQTLVDTGTTTCESTADTITITQSQ